MVLLAGCGGVSDTTTNYVLEDNTGIIYNMHGEPVRNMGTWTDPEFGCEYLIFYHEGLVSNFSSIASAGLSIRYDSDGKPICKGKQ